MYIITLANNDIIKESKCNWDFLPAFPIKQFVYTLPNKRILYLSGFDQYLYFSEKYKIIQGGHGDIVSTINVLGNHKNNVFQFTLRLNPLVAMQRKGVWNKDEFASLDWDVVSKKFIFGNPQKTNHNKWKCGVFGQPIVKIING
jgi:hypothetical protein